MTTRAEGARVLLVVGGGIAAYKAAPLVRRLQADGHQVRVALTRSAESFVTPLTLEVLSGHGVYRQEYLGPTDSGEEIHIVAADWAEVLVVAPATANVIGRLALGLGDEFATTTALAFDGPMVVAPAMHHRMWHHDGVQSNVAALRGRGARFVGPEYGLLANGERGVGRMSEPEAIAEEIEVALGTARSLVGRRVLVSAGPTRESIDPVRYIGNRSSGRMGFALAAEAARRGAETFLVAGPVGLQTPSRVRRIDVRTALEMQAEIDRVAPTCDVIVMTAAVADFRPAHSVDHKVKKEAGPPHVELVANPDILRELAETAPEALRVGFAAETEASVEEAWDKLRRKRCHLLVWNDVSGPNGAFGSETNEVVVYREGRPPEQIPRQTKTRLAGELWTRFEEALIARPVPVATA